MLDDARYALAFAMTGAISNIIAMAAMDLLDLPTRAGVVILLALMGAFFLGNMVGVERAAMSEEQGVAWRRGQSPRQGTP